LTIIAQEAVWQSVSAEQADQVWLNNLHGFSWTGKKSQGVPRMVVLNRQGMTSEIVLQGKVSLKVHLPQEIGRWSFKPLPGCMLGRFRQINTSMPVQNCRNGAGTGQGLLSSIAQPPLDLAPTPSRVSMSHRQNILFFAGRGSIGTGVRAPRTILQSLLSFFLIPMKPFITRFRTNVEASTQTPHLDLLGHSQVNKFSSLTHNSTFFPWHDWLLSKVNHHANICVTHVSEHVLPMSPVYTRGLGRGAT